MMHALFLSSLPCGCLYREVVTRYSKVAQVDRWSKKTSREEKLLPYREKLFPYPENYFRTGTEVFSHDVCGVSVADLMNGTSLRRM